MLSNMYKEGLLMFGQALYFIRMVQPKCLNLKKVDTFGNNTKSKNETKDTDTTSVQ